MFSFMCYEREQRRRFFLCLTCMVTVTLLLLATILSLNSSNKTQFHTVSKGVNFFKTTVATIPSSVSSSPYSTSSNADIITTAGTSAKSPNENFIQSVQKAKLLASSARATAYNHILARAKSKTRASTPPTAFDDCLELLNNSMEQLDGVLNANKKSRTIVQDIQTWLSAALTNQVTCSDGLSPTGQGKQAVLEQVDTLSKQISNSLALHAAMNANAGSGERPSDGFPEWVTEEDRKLLEASTEDIKPDAVVSKDGSGTHGTINEAIAFVSLKSSGGGGGRTVIYVKAGTYNEYIRIPTKQKYVMLMGDGKGKSIIIGNQNNEDGWSTYQTATVAAMGAGFIAKGVTIINSSGPTKHQAVALRVGGDLSVIYQCSIQGYQDTLYAYANRQFYRDCDISGTVDFIFGNSAAVFQNCLIQPKKPAGGQRNSITAQGRSDPNQNTGFSIHGSQISGFTGGAQTYLGRPWKQYSRVVIMKTAIDGSVNSAGWEQWSGNFALSTLYYGEYANTGPGAVTSGRVRWPGVHPAMSEAEASMFTVGNFISGNSWLPGTGVVFNAGL